MCNTELRLNARLIYYFLTLTGMNHAEKNKKIWEKCKERREMGAKKYGPDAYKTKDMFEEARFEGYDQINYAIGQLYKLDVLEEKYLALEQKTIDMERNLKLLS